MIRWRFVLTRLLIVIAVLALLGWGMGPVAQYVTVRSLETATGSQVDIKETRVGLFPPRIHFSEVQVADPRDDKEMRDAFRADSIDLVMDGNALLHRRWVAKKGIISGVEIGARRKTSGRLNRLETLDSDERASTSPSLDQLIGTTTNRLTDEAKAVLINLETVKCSEEIRAQWEAEYDRLVIRAKNLETQIRGVRDEARVIQNPLRDLPELQRTLARARNARSELGSVHRAIDSLPNRLQADLVRLDQAKQIDLAKVDQYVPGDLASSGDLGVEMLGDAVRDQIQQIRSYLDSGRTLANYTVVAPESVRIRGVDHDLNPQPSPGLLVRRCEVTGLLRAGGKRYEMTGFLENLTPNPEKLDKPTRVGLRLNGPEVVRVEYVRDRRRDAKVDLLTLHWPEITAQPLHIGRGGETSIVINGGQRELWVQIRAEGEQLEGRLVSKQTGVSLDLNAPEKFANSAAADSLRDSLSFVDRIEMDAKFSGTWRDLDLKLTSNLGQILRRAGEDAIAKQVADSKRQLAATIRQEHANQSLALQQWLGSRQNEAQSLLANAEKFIDEMGRKVQNEVGDADAYLGKLRGAIRGKLR
ncbi:TIGR03545 family protein [Rubripirellula sp.]|nr:TIGR03545 family protein [Rubripirellula sp.]MDA7874560.1 TIGR03545 family protein [Rhodopirellula sp.]MDB4621282.1 TIGR03545 family protein [Rubripirellula sp.]MDB4644725.1 TIGR03545 family protein [Rubripirellula sp.]